MIDYTALAKIFEMHMTAHVAEGTPDSLYTPIRYINQLGGKRIRPVLLLMSYNIWHDDLDPALPAALAIEFFHNFSLMHDDIMDEASLRRGRESVHTKFGRNAAILSGDAMLIKCFQYLLEAGNKKNVGAELCSLMAGTAITICEGQQLDMDFEIRDSILENEYLEMIRKKTACLLGLSLQIGAIIAGAPQKDADSLYRFGESLGMAFQIRDDYLDVFGNTALTGKQSGGDIIQGKKNFLYVRTFNSLSGAEKETFNSLYIDASSTNKIERVLNFYKEQGIEEYVKKIENIYFNRALQSIHPLSIKNGNVLISFAEEIFIRDH
jgi:geranylgeranyl diphosphate synthase type II